MADMNKADPSGAGAGSAKNQEPNYELLKKELTAELTQKMEKSMMLL